MALRNKTRRTIDGHRVIGHLPREISHFSECYYDYGGEKAFISSIAFKRSSILQGGLEISIVLKIFESEAPDRIFDSMKEKVNSYYTELDQIQLNDKGFSDIDIQNNKKVCYFFKKHSVKYFLVEFMRYFALGACVAFFAQPRAIYYCVLSSVL